MSLPSSWFGFNRFSTCLLFCLSFATAQARGDGVLEHYFTETLAPVAGTPTDSETADLQKAADAFVASRTNGTPDWQALTSFIANHPQSPWNASLLLNLGDEYYENGYFSRALEAWQQSWLDGQSATNGAGHAIADRAAAQWLRMLCRVGRLDDVKAALGEVQGRHFSGSTAEMIETSRESLWMMENHPELTYRCGPHALERIWLYTKTNQPIPRALVHSTSGINGIPLTDVATLANQIGLGYQMAKRIGNADIPLPAVAHWKLNHYGALLKAENGRYLMDDPTFGNGLLWISQDAVDSESDGYFLLPPGPLPDGWQSVSQTEGGQVWGRGYPPDDDPDSDGPDDPSVDFGDGNDDDPGDPISLFCNGMARWNIFLMMADLSLLDSPEGYVPPVGPPIYFNVHYNQQESDQPAVFTYGNMGPQWTCDFISSLTFDTANAYYHRGQGGVETFPGYDPATQTYAQSMKEDDTLVQLSPTNYELLRADGGKLIFSQPDNPASPTRIFMTAIIDPQGNAATMSYDTNLRLVAITDAIGQVTAVGYGTGAQSLLVSKVTDPFGRSALFQYDSLNELTNITDVAGMTSGFSYVTNEVGTVQSLTTGYGTTTFAVGTTNNNRYVIITEPDGEQEEALQGNGTTPGVAFSDPLVPAGILAFNEYLDGRDTYYWNRGAMAEAHGVYPEAKIYHFMHQDLNTRSPILESIKMPSQNRIWYNYQGQNSSGFYNYGMYAGAPSKIGLVLDNGQTQLTQRSYNSLGALTEEIDPVGRTQLYSYASNNIDMTAVRRLTAPGVTNTIASFTWNAAHRPLTITDASGQTTTWTYNSQGQPLTATDPNGAATIFNYNSSNYLTSIEGPLGASDTVTLTYDAYGRPHTLMDVGGYTLTYSYDALDRVTNVTYPDQTFTQQTYHLLDPASFTDRRGRVTLYNYDSLRQLVSIQDPLGRTTQFEWCGCGSLSAVIDAMGRMTQWTHDPFGRLTAMIFPDGTQETYAYDSAGLLKSVTDPASQSKLFTHGLDNLVTSISYGNAATPTPPVQFIYDAFFPRLTQRVDGAGITSYSYNPIGVTPSMGAGQLQSILGPLPGDTITFQYDALGRVTNRAINGVAETVAYDAAGRIVGANNALGAFSYSYVGATPRLASVGYPTGQSTILSYFPNSADHRLQEIWNKLPTGATLSKFDYAYDEDGFITSLTQQHGSSAARQMIPSYDLADRLTGATLNNPTQTFAYSYDAADNRLTETSNNVQSTAVYDALNQAVSYSTNVETPRTYQWDAEGRLASISYPTTGQSTQFTYDGLNHCVRIVEMAGGSVASDRQFIWAGERIAEELDAAGTVTNHYFSQGVQVAAGAAAGAYYYALDQLGSVEELTDAGGNLRADYEYDPWGAQTKLSGDLNADFGFTGFYLHAPSSLYLAPLRAYDPALGRWTSRDPILRKGGSANLYAYVDDEPIDAIDPFGADTITVGIYTTPLSGINIPEGHASINLGDGYTGFYPDPTVGAFGPNGPQTSTGVIRSPLNGENQSPEFAIPIYNVSPQQVQQMKNYIQQVRQNPCMRNYNLLNRNCASFVREVLRAGGINLGGSQTPLGVLIHAGIQSGISSASGFVSSLSE